jgi:glycosyltransferase involved in cell wall biosynthesis
MLITNPVITNLEPQVPNKMQVLHIITDFDDGGAQAVLYRFIMADRTNDHQVISLISIGWYGDRLIESGVKVYSLGMPNGKLTVGGLTKLYRLIREINPEIIQTWMYHSDLVGSIIARLAGKKILIWGIHNTDLDPDKTAISTRLTVRACAMLSKNIPQQIISCSQEGVKVHTAIGYQYEKIVVVPNGYDVSEFSPNPATRIELRRQWQIAENTTLFGMVARWNPQKDHPNLIKALAHLQTQFRSNWHCVLVGSDLTADNQVLAALIAQYRLTDRISLLGVRTDISAVMNALDLHILSSAYGEAFPNVVSEAMACGTPCVVTTVGDAALIVGDTGWAVPPKDPIQLATAISAAVQARANQILWAERQAACRQRIQDNFSLQIMVDKYHDVWKNSIAVESKN